MSKPSTLETNLKIKTSGENVTYLSDPEPFSKQEELYLSVRKKEGRVYSDEILQKLPKIEMGHPLFEEWQVRAQSIQRLTGYLKSLGKHLRILDIGCGNGWISSHIAKNLDCQVFALDVNEYELKQGAQVFKETINLRFFFGNIFEHIFPDQKIDIIILASSIQYFPDIKKLLNHLNGLMTNLGEIHIIDSPFYGQETVTAAKARTLDYYKKLGFPEMANYYYHHLYPDLQQLCPKLLFNPNSFIHRIKKKFSKEKVDPPFPWIKIPKFDK